MKRLKSIIGIVVLIEATVFLLSILLGVLGSSNMKLRSLAIAAFTLTSIPLPVTLYLYIVMVDFIRDKNLRWVRTIYYTFATLSIIVILLAVLDGSIGWGTYFFICLIVAGVSLLTITILSLLSEGKIKNAKYEWLCLLLIFCFLVVLYYRAKN